MSCVTSGKMAQKRGKWFAQKSKENLFGTKQVHSKIVEKSPLGEKCVMYQKKLVFLQF